MRERTNEAIWIESRSRWQINVQRDGIRRTFTSSTPGTKGKVEAEKRADKWLEEGFNKDVRFEQAWKAFLKEQEITTGTSNFLKHSSIGRTWLLPRLKHKRLSSITPQDWQDCINDAYKKGRSKKTLKNIRASATAFHRYCRKDRKPLQRPEDLTIPRDAPVGERKILQPDQLRTLFSVDTITHYKRPVHCFYINAWRFEVLTGLRPGEVAGIERARDLKEQLLQIKRSINQYNEITDGKTERARRNMLISRHALDVLQDQADMLKRLGITSRWVFPGPDGGPMDTKQSYKRWLTYRRQHGITCSLYELRHTMISLIKSDMPEALLKRIVGHSKNMDTLGTYGHDVDGDLQRAQTILESVFDRILGE